ncbi:hypothetical protein CYY_009102 [Polysphondylium violaceum]|uniref:glycerol kinase n=1 Tax=Polysphondylium violaceum TaxID=133409 RepID=A0A8J4PND1_9MYCE|nr:hypothetical protein CYY_009102 [Polysphondylium violaceum]
MEGQQFILGIDLGTSAVKVLVCDRHGNIVTHSTKPYELDQSGGVGYSEQNPEHWVHATFDAIKEIVHSGLVKSDSIAGMSFSGMMHTLVLLDKQHNVLRPAILWNDTRNSKQCNDINKIIGSKKFIEITGNKPLEGFTLPKILWVKENQPDIYSRMATFLLPKDYLRFRITGKIGMELSDASGCVMMDMKDHKWSKEILDPLGIDIGICPPLYQSLEDAGPILKEVCEKTGLSINTKVFFGAADNAAAAIGGGAILSPNQALSMIGSSGVVLNHESEFINYNGEIHTFIHAIPNQYYSMGVTLNAGYSLSWLKNILQDPSIVSGPDDIKTLVDIAKNESCVGAKGLLFTPYLNGERTPYTDSQIRASFIGLDSTHKRGDLVRSCLEGIVFSFQDIFEIYNRVKSGSSSIDHVIALGGGSKSDLWMQIQADIFNKPILSLENSQGGPSLGAAMIAAVALQWYPDFEQCSKAFLKFGKSFNPIAENQEKYSKLYQIYRKVYESTKEICHQLYQFK